ncbi:transposase [Streptomyces sp. NPDC059533]|uniref:transposase n=1 Tax=unclassified Streptomyces TaxID=2593676 RepID=UPI003679E306
MLKSPLAGPARHRTGFVRRRADRLGWDHSRSRGFAAFLQNDWDAVVNGLTLNWSSGAVEGQVTRIKPIERRSYGRASFAFLRALVLAEPP